MISHAHVNRRSYNWLAYDTLDYFLKKFSPLYKGTLYDLGSGESFYRDFFLQHVDTYIAVDWMQSYHEIKADIIADLNEPLPIDDQTADTVVSLSVLEHLQKPQIMIDEAFRILKSGGWIVLQVPWQWWVHEAPYDYFRYTPYGLEHLFERAGFVNIKVEPQAGFFTTIILKMNYFSLRFIRGPRLVRLLLRGIFGIYWFIGQKFAPVLDKLDKDWALEASGYFLTARKP